MRTFTNSDHIGDINEMILYPLAAVETGGPGGFDDRLEISVIGVAKDFGKVPAGPELVARRIRAADGFKRCDFVAHGESKCVHINSSSISFRSFTA